VRDSKGPPFEAYFWLNKKRIIIASTDSGMLLCNKLKAFLVINSRDEQPVKSLVDYIFSMRQSLCKQ